MTEQFWLWDEQVESLGRISRVRVARRGWTTGAS